MAAQKIPVLPSRESFWNAAKRGSFVYCYLRSKNSRHGKINSPYYVGISSSASRPTANHGAIAVPRNRNMIRILRSGLSWRDAIQWERFYIDHYGRIDLQTGCLHNRTDGGEGIENPSQETREKISAAAKRPERIAMLREMARLQKGVRPELSDDQRFAMGSSTRGVPKSSEWKKFMSNKMKENGYFVTHSEQVLLAQRLSCIKNRAKWAHSVGLRYLDVNIDVISPGKLRNLKRKARKGYVGSELLRDLRRNKRVSI